LGQTWIPGIFLEFAISGQIQRDYSFGSFFISATLTSVSSQGHSD